MLILNNRETLRTNEVRYHLSRQAKGKVLTLSFAFPEAMMLPNALRGSHERRYAAQVILKQRNILMKAVRGARGSC